MCFVTNHLVPFYRRGVSLRALLAVWLLLISVKMEVFEVLIRRVKQNQTRSALTLCPWVGMHRQPSVSRVFLPAALVIPAGRPTAWNAATRPPRPGLAGPK